LYIVIRGVKQDGLRVDIDSSCLIWEESWVVHHYRSSSRLVGTNEELVQRNESRGNFGGASGILPGGQESDRGEAWCCVVLIRNDFHDVLKTAWLKSTT